MMIIYLPLPCTIRASEEKQVSFIRILKRLIYEFLYNLWVIHVTRARLVWIITLGSYEIKVSFDEKSLHSSKDPANLRAVVVMGKLSIALLSHQGVKSQNKD